MTKRYDIIDLWRTAALVTMIAYHLIYDLWTFGYITREQVFSLWPQLLQRFTCYSFIFISGAACRFSRGNIRRGLITLGCGVAVAVVARLAGMTILFGILHFLGVSMIIYGLAGKYLERIPKYVAPFLWLALFIGTKIIVGLAPPVEARWLFPLGFVYPGFFSSDYFALLPWLFLFLLGTWLGGILKSGAVQAWLGVRFPRLLTLPGRHTLVIYMVHQPVLYGVFYLVSSLNSSTY